MYRADPQRPDADDAASHCSMGAGHGLSAARRADAETATGGFCDVCRAGRWAYRFNAAGFRAGATLAQPASPLPKPACREFFNRRSVPLPVTVSRYRVPRLARPAKLALPRGRRDSPIARNQAHRPARHHRPAALPAHHRRQRTRVTPRASSGRLFFGGLQFEFDRRHSRLDGHLQSGRIDIALFLGNQALGLWGWGIGVGGEIGRQRSLGRLLDTDDPHLVVAVDHPG